MFVSFAILDRYRWLKYTSLQIFAAAFVFINVGLWAVWEFEWTWSACCAEIADNSISIDSLLYCRTSSCPNIRFYSPFITICVVRCACMRIERIHFIFVKITTPFKFLLKLKNFDWLIRHECVSAVVRTCLPLRPVSMLPNVVYCTITTLIK